MSGDYHSAHTLGTGRGMMPGVGSRTPISFISVLDESLNRYTSDFQKVKRLVTDEYLIYIYRKWLGKGWYCFVMFQSARKRGSFNVEIGIAKRKELPYFWHTSLPDYSCDAVRERLAVIMEQDEDFYRYGSERELGIVIKNLLTNFIGSGIHEILDERRDKIEVSLTVNGKVLKAVREKLKETEERDPVKLFPDAFKIKECYDYFKENIKSRTFFRFYPHEFIVNFANEEFILAAARIMSEIMSAPTIKEEAARVNKNPHEYLDDLTYWLTGRVPPETYTEPLEDVDEQVIQYCYVKAISTLESLLGIEKELKEREEQKR